MVTLDYDGAADNKVSLLRSLQATEVSEGPKVLCTQSRTRLVLAKATGVAQGLKRGPIVNGTYLDTMGWGQFSFVLGVVPQSEAM